MLNQNDNKNIEILKNFFIQDEYKNKNEHERFKLLIDFIIKNKIQLNQYIYIHLQHKTEFKQESEDLKELLQMFIFDSNFIE